MTIVRAIFCAVLFVVVLAGCGGNRDKNINKDKDRPESTQNK